MMREEERVRHGSGLSVPRIVRVPGFRQIGDPSLVERAIKISWSSRKWRSGLRRIQRSRDEGIRATPFHRNPGRIRSERALQVQGLPQHRYDETPWFRFRVVFDRQDAGGQQRDCQFIRRLRRDDGDSTQPGRAILERFIGPTDLTHPLAEALAKSGVDSARVTNEQEPIARPGSREVRHG